MAQKNYEDLERVGTYEKQGELEAGLPNRKHWVQSNCSNHGKTKQIERWGTCWDGEKNGKPASAI